MANEAANGSNGRCSNVLMCSISFHIHVGLLKDRFPDCPMICSLAVAPTRSF